MTDETENAPEPEPADDAERLLREALGEDPGMNLVAEGFADIRDAFLNHGFSDEQCFAIIQPVATAVIMHDVQQQMQQHAMQAYAEAVAKAQRTIQGENTEDPGATDGNG